MGIIADNNGRCKRANLAEAKKLPAEWLKNRCELRDLDNGVIGIPYFDDAGNELFVRRRNPPGSCPRFLQEKGVKLKPYGLHRLHEATQDRRLFFCEGESDTWTLWYCDLPALGIPGANTTNSLEAQHLDNIDNIYLLPDNDAAGKQFVEGIRKRLIQLGYDGRLRLVEIPNTYKDVSEWYIAVGKEAFENELTAALLDAELLSVGPGRESSKRESVKSPSQQPSVRVRTVAPYQLFPLDTLTPEVRGFVRQAAAALGCDPALIALPALAVLAAAIGNTRAIRLKRGWTEPAILWTAIVSDSGTLKSPAFALAVSYLFVVQERLLSQHKTACADYEKEMEAWKKAKSDDGDPGDKPERPTLARCIVSDTTIEKLGEILEENLRGLLVGRDELAGWIGSFTKYKAKASGSDVPNWLELHRAGTVIIDRKTGDRKTLFIKCAAASVAGGIQPGVLAKALTGDLFDSGLAARLLLACPPRQPKRWTEAEIDPTTEKIYHDLIDNLLALDFADLEGKPVPLVLRLSEEAKKTWIAFYDIWADEQAAAEGELAAAYSKLEGYAARFALIHHVVSHAAHKTEDMTPIRVESIEAGIALARWFANEARRIYSTLTESTEERERRQLMDFVRSRGGSITIRQLQKSNSRKYPDRATAEQALNDLAEAGLGDWQEGPVPERGGHKIRILILRPTLDTSDTRSDGDEGEDEGPSDTRSGTRLRTPAKQGKNGRLSEVSSVGTGNKGEDGGQKCREGESDCRNECRQREPGEEG